ncbi:MAG: DUF945 domain-containing protein [Synergistaceae bacterium]|jgi:hypothetical protein|nr:DUF945 domain-containing protein [Synergistaceae bacterium]
MKLGQWDTLDELVAAVHGEDERKHDYKLDTRQMHVTVDGELVVSDISGHYGLTDNAHQQIGSLTKIPMTYYRRMQNEAPELLAHNINDWFNRKPAPRMLRTLAQYPQHTDNTGYQYGTARALLSDSYKRIDNPFILDALFPVLNGCDGLKIKSLDLTPNKMYIKIVNPRMQGEIRKGDVVQTGVMISNSEIGCGAVTVRPLIYRLVCTNGMIAADRDAGNGMRKYHVGRVVDYIDADFTVLSDETVIADQKALAMTIADVTRSALSKETFERVTGRMRDAAEVQITSNDIPRVVELMSKDYDLSAAERIGVQDALIRDGDFSLYGLANAVTRTSQGVESYDRATDLETAGWRVLNTPKSQWSDWNRAA